MKMAGFFYYRSFGLFKNIIMKLVLGQTVQTAKLTNLNSNWSTGVFLSLKDPKISQF